ncbi:MAG: class I SAM-dependent methyltransferase [Candidatus Thorarchaeota archaeon]|nr:class I SAM-dependent methyltransferase [Candidatus Thorarchaeota archaeon]
MGEYYSDCLSAWRLKKCYDIAPKRTRQYLEAEISYILSKIDQQDSVLELGCGYGRILRRLVPFCTKITGIDISLESLALGLNELQPILGRNLLQVNADTLPFANEQFDFVLCVQNGISAFKLDSLSLVKESMRVTRSGGLCLFSSYSEKFWGHRLEWFRLQSEQGLIGPINWEETRNGIIVCEDGFRATTYRAKDFKELAARLGVRCQVIEVDDSCLFCEIPVK